MFLRYVGSGPNCYANSLAMVMGAAGETADPSAIEVLTERQTRLVGSLQYDLVAGNTGDAVQTLHRLAPTYQDLHAALTPTAAR